MEANKEDKVIVLDFLPNGYSFDQRPVHLKTPIAQVIGTDHFTLLEVTPKKGVHLQPYERAHSPARALTGAWQEAHVGNT